MSRQTAWCFVTTAPAGPRTTSVQSPTRRSAYPRRLDRCGCDAWVGGAGLCLPTRTVRESLAESRESANLLEDAQNIADTTMFNNLPVADAEQRHAYHAPCFAGGGYAEHIAGMRAGDSDERRNAISFSNQLVNGDVKVRNHLDVRRGDRPGALETGWEPGEGRGHADIGRDDRTERVQITVVQDLLVSADEVLVRF